MTEIERYSVSVYKKFSFRSPYFVDDFAKILATRPQLLCINDMSPRMYPFFKKMMLLYMKQDKPYPYPYAKRLLI